MLRIPFTNPLRIGLAVAALIGLLPLAMATYPTLPVLVAAGSIAGAGIEIFSVSWDTALQTHVSADRLARIYSYDVFGSLVAVPIGQMAAGPAASRYGVDPVLIAAGAVALVAPLAPLALGPVRDVRIEKYADDRQPATLPSVSRAGRSPKSGR